jgi:hypothetical protein
VRIDINLKQGPKQQLFLDYLNARIGPRMSQASGSARFGVDGTFESIVVGPFSVDQKDDPVALTWRYVKSKDGELLFIEIQHDAEMAVTDKWHSSVHELVIGAFKSALEVKQELFFRRTLFNYIGPQLDGEYWFGAQTRFAPLWPDDDQPLQTNAERVVSIDQMIPAIDNMDAWAIAQQSSARLAARLSLLLNAGLYRPPAEQRWVLPPEGGKSIRGLSMFSGHVPAFTDLPKKGALCGAGGWSGSLTSQHKTTGLLSLPREARRVLRAIDATEPAITESFNAASRLYQVALVLEAQFPSVSLAYRVAAVEALSKADPSVNGFSEFMRKTVKSITDLNSILNFLYGTVRSGHFHAGEFPLGEHDRMEFPRAFMGSEYITKSNLRLTSFAVTREAIINWLVDRLPPEQNSTLD